MTAPDYDEDHLLAAELYEKATGKRWSDAASHERRPYLIEACMTNDKLRRPANEMASLSAITRAKMGARVRDRNGHTAVRTFGGWRYEASAAPGLMQDWQMVQHAPLQVLEVVELPKQQPPVPNRPQSVIGRFEWSPGRYTPWVQFDSITQFRQWARDIRSARPGTKVSMAYLGLHTPASLLSSAKHDGQRKQEDTK